MKLAVKTKQVIYVVSFIQHTNYGMELDMEHFLEAAVELEVHGFTKSFPMIYKVKSKFVVVSMNLD